MFKKLLSITMVLMLILTSVSFAFAENKGKEKGRGNSPKFKTESIQESEEAEIVESSDNEEEIEEIEEEEVEDEENDIDDESRSTRGKGKGLDKAWKEMKAAIRNTYSEEELESIENIGEDLREKGMRVLPVENIINKRGKFKFDIPPVIKEGRTLIPVRAISEGFGAQVDWDGENKIVTIIKGETTITLKLDDRTATVNGEEVELDAAAELMNNRTVVPLRFIAESLGLKVDWDEEAETIELDEDVEDEEIDEEAEENEEADDEEEDISEDEVVDEEASDETEEDTTIEDELTEEDTNEEELVEEN